MDTQALLAPRLAKHQKQQARLERAQTKRRQIQRQQLQRKTRGAGQTAIMVDSSQSLHYSGFPYQMFRRQFNGLHSGFYRSAVPIQASILVSHGKIVRTRKRKQHKNAPHGWVN
jgi:hypothetical protein